MKIISLIFLIIYLLTFVSCNSIVYNSPKITHFEWGKIKVGSAQYKDIKLWPNHSEEWDWSKTNTKHVPGIQIADLSDFISEIDTIVLSEGVDGVLQIHPETIKYLNDLDKIVIIARSKKAVEKYNELAQKGEKVGALIHSTC